MKSLKTIKETPKGKNLKSIDTKTGKKTKNPVLVEETKRGKHKEYEVVKPKKKDEYLRSKSDKKKENNLDPKVNIVPKKKVDKKK